MCGGLGEPPGVTEALGMLERALDHLNSADAASLPSAVQAEVLRGLARVEAKHTAARARVLTAFAGELSESWARQVCTWTDRLPLGQQGDADEILAAAARGGVDLAGLAGLAQEMYERTHRDRDGDGAGDDGYGDRALWLDSTLGGAPGT